MEVVGYLAGRDGLLAGSLGGLEYFLPGLHIAVIANPHQHGTGFYSLLECAGT